MRQNFFRTFTGKRESEKPTSHRILLLETEAIRIEQLVRSSPGIEIGGDLFGFFGPDGSPIVFAASGPGPAARRGVTHFEQDAQFQSSVFHELTSRFRMFYVGDWHSHHNLELSNPSGSDDAKLADLATKNSWPRLCSLIIQTDGGHHRPEHRTEQHRSFRENYGDQNQTESPVRAYGILWNAFQYEFTQREQMRQRVAVEFHPWENPLGSLATAVFATAGGEASSPTHYATTAKNLPIPDYVGGLSNVGSSTLDIYKKLCKIIAQEIENVGLEVDPNYGGVPCLLVSALEQIVVCNVRELADAALAVTIDCIGRDHIAFTVPCPRGSLDPVDARAIATRIIEVFNSRNERDNLDLGNAKSDMRNRGRRKT
jgi:hypothetical protein